MPSSNGPGSLNGPGWWTLASDALSHGRFTSRSPGTKFLSLRAGRKNIGEDGSTLDTLTAAVCLCVCVHHATPGPQAGGSVHRASSLA